MVRREVREEKGQDLDLFVVNSYGSLAQVGQGGGLRVVLAGAQPTPPGSCRPMKGVMNLGRSFWAAGHALSVAASPG